MMRDPNRLSDHTRAGWRLLGFHYKYGGTPPTWTIRASRAGLDRFCNELKKYAADLKHSGISEHEHYGPYSYLKFVTWNEAKIVEDGLYGQPDDFRRLAESISVRCSQSPIGTQIRIDSEFSAKNEAILLIHIEQDEFDPASADASIM